MNAEPASPAAAASHRRDPLPEPDSAAARPTAPKAKTKSTRRGGRPSRRDEIVRAASDAFAASGFHNTSLNDIAEQLDMTPAGILHHFKLKENLLTAVLEYRDETGSAYAQGDDFFDNLVSISAKNTNEPGLTQLFTVLSAESVTEAHPAQDWFRARYIQVRDSAEEAFVERLGDDASLVADEIKVAARAIVAVMDGLQIQWLLDPENQPMQPSLRMGVDALLAGLRATAATRRGAAASSATQG